LSLIRFKDVSHYYGAAAAVNDLSFEIEDQKITAIIGKSGSGKSTLLQIINGLIKPSKGEVIVFGKSLDHKNIHKARLKIGYSVQGTGLFPHMTVYQAVSSSVLGYAAQFYSTRQFFCLMKLLQRLILKPKMKFTMNCLICRKPNQGR
jgi:ABC-type proline/glycine betaine transport system ATPase subunit